MHKTRDGVSLLRIVNPAHPAYNRVIPNFGDYLGGLGQSFLNYDLMKYVRPVGIPSSGRKYDMRKPPVGDYETFAYGSITALPDLSDCNTLMDALIDAQFDNIADSNPINDGSLVL
jgi:hypothetical protein